MSVAVPLEIVVGFALALTRILGVLLFAPIFGHRVVPARVRLGVAVLLAWMVAPQAAVDPSLDDYSLGLAALREAAIGASLGFATSIVFSGFALMGEVAAMQGGLGASAVLDPATGANSVVLSSLASTLAGLVFLAAGGHHDVLRGVFLSFELLPPGADPPAASGFAELARLGAVIFEVAVRLAAPFTAVMLASNVAVGMLGRVVPQLNLISLQLPAQIGLTLLILALAAGPLVEAIASILDAQIPRAFGALHGLP